VKISEHFQRKIVDPTKELEAQLSEIELIAKFVSRAITLRPRLNRVIDWDSVATYDRSLVTEFLDLRGANEGALLNSLLVVCYGTFEKFVVELIVRLIESINRSCKDIANVPISILNENIYWTGRILQTVKTQKNLREYNYVELAEGLSTCSVEKSKFTLNAACFAYEAGIMNSRNLEKLFGRVGVSINWDEFGTNDDLICILGASGTRDCSKKLRKTLDELVIVRNIVSHTGGQNIARDVNEVLNYTALLRTFCILLALSIGSQVDKKFSS